MAAEAIFTITQIIVNAWIETSIDMSFATFSFVAFVNSEVLIGAEVFNHLELTFQFFVFEEFFVVHLLLIKKLK